LLYNRFPFFLFFTLYQHNVSFSPNNFVTCPFSSLRKVSDSILWNATGFKMRVKYILLTINKKAYTIFHLLTNKWSRIFHQWWIHGDRHNTSNKHLASNIKDIYTMLDFLIRHIHITHIMPKIFTEIRSLGLKIIYTFYFSSSLLCLAHPL